MTLSYYPMRCHVLISIPEQDLFGAPLTREIHTAQKAAQVSRQRNETDCQKFNRQTVAWQIYSPLSGADMYPPHQPYHHARDAREYQVQQKNSLQLLSLELELPRE